MSSPVVIAPTKSICRSGVGRTRIAIRQQQRLRQRHLYQFKGRRRLTSEPRFCSGSTTQQNTSLSSTIKIHRLSPTRSFSTRTGSALATEFSRSKDNENTLTIATITMAAVTILLGGTYQREHRRKLQEQENGMKNERGETAVISGLSPLSRNSPDEHDSSGTENLKEEHPHRKLFDDLIAGIKSAVAPNSDAISSHMEPLRRQAVKNPISSQFHQPRNVMISRMRSVAGRGLHEKYKVDWNTVLGEGAYGSVHPARLALTGEKVALKKISKRYTNSSAFFLETDALLRIYDNGGHPNISGLRDMVSLCYTLMIP